jgi:hypothetical protein
MTPDSSSRIPCRFCAAPLSAEDVNIQLAIAKCSACHAVYSFADDAAARAGTPPRPKVQLPPSFKVERSGGGLMLERRWFTPVAFFLVFFCMFWDGFLVFWYAAGIASGEIIMLVFPLLHVAAGVGLTYYTAALFVNRTFVRAGGGRLSIEHKPLPWPGKRDLSTGTIRQLFCKEQVHKTKNGKRYSYQVHAKQSDGTDIIVVKGLAKPEEALFIEQELESFLRIEDRPVAGELPRN